MAHSATGTPDICTTRLAEIAQLAHDIREYIRTLSADSQVAEQKGFTHILTASTSILRNYGDALKRGHPRPRQRHRVSTPPTSGYTSCFPPPPQDPLSRP